MSTDSTAAPRIETWVSSLMLSPRETEKLVIYQVAELARRRRGRGLRLNFPESIALIAEALLEAARDGRSVAEVIELGGRVLTRDDVMEGVPEMVNLVQVEANLWTGLFAPEGTPKTVVNLLNGSIGRIWDTPEMKSWLLTGLGGEFTPNTPDQFAAFLASDSKRWRQIIKQMDLHLD